MEPNRKRDGQKGRGNGKSGKGMQRLWQKANEEKTMMQGCCTKHGQNKTRGDVMRDGKRDESS